MIRLRVKEIATQQGISMIRLSRLVDTNYKTINAIFDDPFREVTRTTLKGGEGIRCTSFQLIGRSA